MPLTHLQPWDLPVCVEGPLHLCGWECDGRDVLHEVQCITQNIEADALHDIKLTNPVPCRGFTIDTKFGDCSKNTKDFVVARRANPDESKETTTVGVISSDGNTVYGIADGQTVSQVISVEESEFPHEVTTYESLTVVISKPYSFDDGENITMAARQQCRKVIFSLVSHLNKARKDIN